ncbi:MAG TPA: zinc-dependent alcohol dehydrogenase family protein [Gemmataceae bacterium]|nr:zinc-dependent alcohol dehydrogenase family protein [Gemmataceae bacterium]
MKAVVCENWGDPAEVLQVRDLPTPEPARGQVRVRMLVSPINPSDLMMVRGRYGIKPLLPAVPGFEGVGVVEAGSGLPAWWRKNKRVVVPNGAGGNWAEQVVVPALQVWPAPAALTDEQAATFFVNPASAVIMTRFVLAVPPDAWLLQTAAGSALGRMVIRLGRRYGFRTINVVRRREQAEELLREGADAVVATDAESLTERVLALTNGAGVAYAIDCVGGPTGSEVVGVLASGGRMLVYGTLSDEPLRIDPRILIGGQKRIEGFWLSDWIRKQGILTKISLFRTLGKLIQTGLLATEVGATFPLNDVRAAVRQAAQPGRQGKVLLRIGSR